MEVVTMTNGSSQPTPGGLSPGARRAAILLVVVLAVGLRLYGMTGNITFDSVVYAQDAYNLLHGTFNLATDSWYSHRLPVFVPVALFYAVLGVGNLSTNLWPMILSVLQVLAVLWVGRRLFGAGTAILAAAFMAMIPLDVIYAGVLAPDAILAALLTFSAAFWILGLEGRDKPSWLYLVVSGAFCALAGDARAYALFIAVFFAGHALVRRIALRALLWWVLGFALVIVPLVAVYARVTGDPLVPIRAMTAFYGEAEHGQGAGLLAYPLLVLKPGSFTGLFALFIAAAGVWALARRTRQRWILLGWIAPILLYLQFGSMSLTSYVPVFKRVRFLTPLMAPGALLLASALPEALALAGDRVSRTLNVRNRALMGRVLLVCAVLVLLANSLWVTRGFRGANAPVAAAFKSAVGVLRSDTHIPVLFDHWRTSIRFAYYFGFKEGSHLYEGADETKRMLKGPATAGTRLGYLKWYEDPDSIPAAFVVLEDGIMTAARKASADDPTRSRFPAKDIPYYAEDPPKSWKLLSRFGSLSVFRTPGRFEPGAQGRQAEGR